MNTQFCSSLSAVTVDDVTTQMMREQFWYEPIFGDNQGLLGDYGWEMDLFLTPKIYFAAYSSWAAYGDKGGFGIAAVGIGNDFIKSDMFTLTGRSMIGSGGGKNLPTGGGLLLHNLIQAQVYINKQWGISIGASTIHFPLGTFNVHALHFGITYSYERIVLK
jgi:hypothetical protein